MCLIIQRQPNFEIPYQKFATAIENNPHGYGIAYHDNGKLITQRSCERPDSESLYRLVNEELIDKNLLIHFRWTTAGETVLRNSHPFPILERGTDGIDLRMAHNGTLFNYKPERGDWQSDTRRFVRELVRPLFKRMARVLPPEELLNDELTKKILEDQLSSMSVLTFMDGEGRSLVCNAEGNGGKQDEGWYYSNVYSFKEGHREPKNPTKATGTTRVGTTPSSSVAPNFFQTPPDFATDCKVERFTKKYDIKTLSDLLALGDDAIEAIAAKPAESQLLIKELLHELESARDGITYWKKQANAKGVTQ